MKEHVYQDLEPVLLILMRTDMDSMNSGKAQAQACHVGSALALCFEGDNDPSTAVRLYEKWRKETAQGFGHVDVRDGVGYEELQQEVETANRAGAIAELILDPTYPVKDGDVVHYVSIYTCAFVFCDKNSDTYRDLCNRYQRHP